MDVSRVRRSWMKSSRNGARVRWARSPICSWTHALRESPRFRCGRVVRLAGGDRHYARRPTHDPAAFSLSEAEVHWRDFLASLQTRGAAWRAADCQRRPPGDQGCLAVALRRVCWQRCQFHLAKNMLAYVPPSLPKTRPASRCGRSSTPRIAPKPTGCWRWRSRSTKPRRSSLPLWLKATCPKV